MESVCNYCKLESQPLIKAAEYGHEECVLSLIKAGADVNEKDLFLSTALINAAEKGLETCVEELIKVGADVNASECVGFTPLMYAATRGNLSCVRLLIDARANLDEVEMQNGRTALMGAALNGHHLCVDALIEAGADVNIISASRCTGLLEYRWTLPSENHYKCIESIIAVGADVNVLDHLGYNSGYVTVLMALSDFNTRLIRLYLKAGVYINDTKICGHSALEELIKKRKRGEEEEETFKEMIFLLFAAGEKIHKATPNIPEYLKPTMSLMDICRRAIRNYLIELDPKHNLFERIPKLKLPDILTMYLLYNMSVETRKKQ